MACGSAQGERRADNLKKWEAKEGEIDGTLEVGALRIGRASLVM